MLHKFCNRCKCLEKSEHVNDDWALDKNVVFTFSLYFCMPSAYNPSVRRRMFKWNILSLWYIVKVYGLLSPARLLLRTRYTPSLFICFSILSASFRSRSWNHEKVGNINSSTLSFFGIGGNGRSLMTKLNHGTLISRNILRDQTYHHYHAYSCYCLMVRKSKWNILYCNISNALTGKEWSRVTRTCGMVIVHLTILNVLVICISIFLTFTTDVSIFCELETTIRQ